MASDEAGWKIQSGALDFYPFGLQMGSHDGTSRREYTGHERDEETGLDYMMARYKQTCSPRFTSPDPIFDTSLTAPTTWNRYGYVHGDPIGSWDPWGLSDYKEPPEAVDIGLVDYLNVTPPAYGHGVFLLGQILAMHAQWAPGGGPGIGPRGGGGRSGKDGVGAEGPGVGEGRGSQICGPEPQFPHGGYWKPFLEANFGLATQLSLFGWTARVAPRGTGSGLGEWDYKRSTNSVHRAHNPETFGNVNYGATGYAVGLSLHTLQCGAGVVGFIQNGFGYNSSGYPWGWPGIDLPGYGPGIVGMHPVWPFGDGVDDAHAIATGYRWAQWHQCMLDNAS